MAMLFDQMRRISCRHTMNNGCTSNKSSVTVTTALMTIAWLITWLVQNLNVNLTRVVGILTACACKLSFSATLAFYAAVNA